MAVSVFMFWSWREKWPLTVSHVLLLTAVKIATVNISFIHLSLQTWAEFYLPFPSRLEVTVPSLLKQVICSNFCHSYPGLHSFIVNQLALVLIAWELFVLILWYPKVFIIMMWTRHILIYLFSSHICFDFPYHLFYSPNILITNSAPTICRFRYKNICAKKSEVEQNILHLLRRALIWNQKLQCHHLEVTWSLAG